MNGRRNRIRLNFHLGKVSRTSCEVTVDRNGLYSTSGGGFGMDGRVMIIGSFNCVNSQLTEEWLCLTITQSPVRGQCAGITPVTLTVTSQGGRAV